ncbi:MAG: hypothetical protein H7647_10285 [Candidatus Heimdallarchaeota archaeon]|nr:hypothetical protein [Candidatus Heimdallarchaeota archaeon]MCK4254813.1 hypothetical protein [Candidatus Heimdallarchaeota archaeon]
MKHSRFISIAFIISLLVAPFLSTSTTTVNAVVGEESWDYQGVVKQQKHRLKIIPSFSVDPFQMRTFLFCLDQDDITSVDALVALYGIQPIRDSPQYSDFFEITSLGGMYGFNVTGEGMSWVTMTEDVMDNGTAEYDEILAPIYETILTKLKYTHEELFVAELYVQSIFVLRLPIHIVLLNSQLGSVGLWQQINKDKTVIYGNFTTYGALAPLYTDPQEPENPDYWWPQYNVTIAQNFLRTSLPRTHSLTVSFPFLASLAAFGGIVVLLAIVQNVRRKNK